MITGGSSPKGAYILVVELDSPREIEVGSLGSFLFPRGYYTYTGSAMGGIYQRIKRHLNREKKLRWHIDYFLEFGKIREVLLFESKSKIECMINQRIASLFNGRVIAPGFGSGDCREDCKSHLLSITKWLVHNSISEHYSGIFGSKAITVPNIKLSHLLINHSTHQMHYFNSS